VQFGAAEVPKSDDVLFGEMSTEDTEALRRRLQAMSDEELLSSVKEETSQAGWGASSTSSIGTEKVFVKRLPLTDIEATRPYSTRNHFKLPTFYSYGVGSGGFGAWRELAVLQAVSGVQGFPVHLHHRVMPRSAPPRPLPWSEEEYVQYWGGSPAVGRYLQARNSTSLELWIVLEHAGTRADLWLADNSEGMDEVLGQVFDAIAELQARHTVHFDAHLGNVVTDGERCRLVDFGLAMSADLELSSKERTFLDGHHHYDYGVVLGSLGMLLAVTLGEEPSSQMLRHHLDGLGALKGRCSPALLGALDQYRHPALYMFEFFERIRQPDKHSTYDDQVLADLLLGSGVITT
jgi:hypothetical protein